MIGAIIGDIVGSRFEFNNYRAKDFQLFTNECEATDDTYMSLAIAKAIMDSEKAVVQMDNEDKGSKYFIALKELAIKNMQEIGRKHPNCGFGGRFDSWVFDNNPKPYNSFGNGAAMRVSSVGFISKSLIQAKTLSKIVTMVTHNHIEGIKGAEATVVAIFMAKNGASKEEIQSEIETNYYNLDFTIDEIRDTYVFNETCQETVPQAIKAFLEAETFEDAIRTAISVGGDSDTLAAITGSIAQAYYGVSKELENKALSYLDKDMLAIYKEWKEFSS